MSEGTRVERWLPVIGFKGFYEVSDHGRVRSVDRVITDRWGRTRRHRGRVRALVPHPEDGHLQVGLKVNGVETLKKVHRLVLEAFTGPCPPGHEGCHGVGGVGDNHLTNLRWDTHIENMLDVNRHGIHHNTRKAACKLEHLLTAPNLVTYRLPTRLCLACDRTRHAAAKSRAQGHRFDFRAVADAKYAQIMGVAA